MRSPLILRNLFDMLRAIKLDRQPRVRTREIRDEFTDRKLSAKFHAVDLPVP